MKKNLLLSFLLSTLFSHAQTFQKLYGGNNYDRANSVVHTFDGGFIAGGSGFSFDSINSWNTGYLVKIDANGDSLWTKVFNSVGDNSIECVRQTLDSGYVVTGYLRNPNGRYDIMVIKTDQWGNVQWSKVIVDSLSHHGMSIVETNDHGFLATGGYYSTSGPEGVFALRLDASGNMVFFKQYSNNAMASDIISTSDGNYMIAGFSIYEIMLVKIDSTGNVLWSKFYSNSMTTEDLLNVVECADHGFALFHGGFKPAEFYEDINLLKTDSNGNVLWSKRYNLPYTELGHAIKQTSSGGFLLAGRTSSLGVSVNGGFVIKTDFIGNVIWSKIYSGGDNEEIYSIDILGNDEFIFSGMSNSFTGSLDMYLVKADSSGASGCSQFDHAFNCIPDTTTSQSIVLQQMSVALSCLDLPILFNHGGDLYSNCVSTELNPFHLESSILLFPNPAINSVRLIVDELIGTYIDIRVTDLTGKLAWRSIARLNSDKRLEMELDLSDLSTGIYLVTLTSQFKTHRLKLIVEK